MAQFRLFKIGVFFIKTALNLFPQCVLDSSISITYTKQLQFMQLHAEEPSFECNYCIILHKAPQFNPLLHEQLVRSGCTRQICHSTTWLSVISICVDPLKVFYLITTAVEALKLRWRGAENSFENNSIGNKPWRHIKYHLSGPCQQKITHSPILTCLEPLR